MIMFPSYGIIYMEVILRSLLQKYRPSSSEVAFTFPYSHILEVHPISFIDLRRP